MSVRNSTNTNAVDDALRQEAPAALRELVSRIEFAMLTTRARDGSLASRPLQTLQVDADGALWFFTSAASAKVAEIRADARVSLAYADPARKVFVAIGGSAALVDDRAKIAELWSAEQTIFFPQGRDDPSLVLVKVTPDNARCWDGNESPLGVLLKFARAVLRNEASDLGTRADIDFGR